MSRIPVWLLDDPEERAAIQSEHEAPVHHSDALSATNSYMSDPDARDDAVSRSEPAMASSTAANDTSTATAAQHRTRIHLVGTPSIFAPLPPASWIVKGMQLGPGRPAIFAGYGSSGKTFAAQALALAVASGRPPWQHACFQCEQPRRVIHIDHEQGRRGTFLRYQRLAAGMELDWQRDLEDRLRVAVLPRFFLNAEDAEDAYVELCSDDVGLVIIDALKGATPGSDENDSKIRESLDNLTRVSERTKTAFVVLHHAGKIREGQTDGRMALRGSSAIYDAAGLVLLMQGEHGKPKRVMHQKNAPDAGDDIIKDFFLTLEVLRPDGENGEPGASRIVYRSLEEVEGEHSADERKQELIDRVRDVVAAQPGIGVRALREKIGGKAELVDDAVKSLVASGEIEQRRERHSLAHYPAEQRRDGTNG
ncbi:AAA family ATPase [Sorangium sp. So ce1099]|uniref:AAA family ATPase n=1 Tax=Sorangium sp. So ce1099 TaxID=3133331 RepID=UPI003F60D9C0